MEPVEDHQHPIHRLDMTDQGAQPTHVTPVEHGHRNGLLARKQCKEAFQRQSRTIPERISLRPGIHGRGTGTQPHQADGPPDVLVVTTPPELPSPTSLRATVETTKGGNNMKLGLVTTDESYLKNDNDFEIGMINEALNRSGIDSSPVVWHEEHHWPSYDALIFRSPWDYPEKKQEFMAWLDRTQTLTRIINPPPLILWNLDKRYLSELSTHGVNTTPTVFCNTYDECLEAISEISGGDYVIKPNVSVGSRDTGLFTGADPRGHELCQQILRSGRVVLVQPAIQAIQQDAERGLLFFNGQFSHAIKKGAILELGGGYIGGKYTENISLAESSYEEVSLGQTTLEAIRSISAKNHWGADAETPLYARIDVITPSPGEPPMLLEAELFEPSIFIRYSSESLDRFVKAVHERLRSHELPS